MYIANRSQMLRKCRDIVVVCRMVLDRCYQASPPKRYPFTGGFEQS